MNPARSLKQARKRARLTQRELAKRAGLPVSTIARIESGVSDPRVGTLVALLRLCGDELIAMPKMGVGVDRTLIRTMLEQTPRQRLETMAQAARAIGQLRERVRDQRSQ